MVQKQQNKPDPSHPESNTAHPLAPQITESQASPGMFIVHTDSEPTSRDAESGVWNGTPGDSEAGGWRPTL